jgi:hypothetical protein
MEGKFFQREAERPVFGMALHVGIKHLGTEAAFGLIRFELRHIDAIRGEAT